MFLAIVDPGVGTNRQAVAVLSNGKLFLGPDNGILSRVVNWEGQTEVHILSSENVGSDMRSKTFQRRDLFAPIAGKLASGISFDRLGKPGKLKDTFPPPQSRYFDNYCEGEMYIWTVLTIWQPICPMG